MQQEYQWPCLFVCPVQVEKIAVGEFNPFAFQGRGSADTEQCRKQRLQVCARQPPGSPESVICRHPGQESNR